MPLTSVTCRLAGDEEFELSLQPGSKTGFLGVHELRPDYFQAKIREKDGGRLIPLPACPSRLLAAWFFAKGCAARGDGSLGSATFKREMSDVSARPL